MASKLIVQDFDFTLRTVANMHRDARSSGISLRFVSLRSNSSAVTPITARFPDQNIGLDIVQQAVRRDFNKRIHVAFA